MLCCRWSRKKLKDYSYNCNQYHSHYPGRGHLHEIYESNFLSDSWSDWVLSQHAMVNCLLLVRENHFVLHQAKVKRLNSLRNEPNQQFLLPDYYNYKMFLFCQLLIRPCRRHLYDKLDILFKVTSWKIWYWRRENVLIPVKWVLSWWCIHRTTHIHILKWS